MLIHGMSWRLEHLRLEHHGNFRDADGWSQKKLKYLVKTSWGLSFQKLLLLLFSLRWLPSLPWRTGFFCVARNTAVTLPESYTPATSTMGDGFNYTFSGEKLKIARREVLSTSRPVYCSLGKGGWSYRWTWIFSQNHLVWLGEEHFQKNGSKVYRERYSGQIK